MAPAQNVGRPKKDGHDVRHSYDRSEGRLRAIAERAPAEVRDLYREGRVSQVVAAKTGPREPQKRAEVHARVAQALVELGEQPEQGTAERPRVTIRGVLAKGALPARHDARAGVLTQF